MSSLIRNYVYKKLFSLLPIFLRENSKILLYPYGAMSVELIEKKVFDGCNLLGVADKSRNIVVDESLDVNIYHSSQISQIVPDYVLICSLSYHNQIMLELLPDCIRKGIQIIDLCDEEPDPDTYTIEEKISAVLEQSNALLCSNEIRNILSQDKYKDTRRLEPHGFRCYSQHDEDGMLAEIFKRMDSEIPHTFVEFGVGDGLENNSLLLMKLGWHGLWIEGCRKNSTKIISSFSSQIKSGQLLFEHQFIRRDNINELIGSHFIGDVGLLCIDIDGNDYYVWEKIDVIKPYVVIIEYNAKFPPPIKWTINYDAEHIWNLSDYQGASLAAINELGRKKGYQLVGCNLNGTNAFFVRSDQLNERFLISDDLMDYYHPPRYYLTGGYRMMSGHTPDPRMGKIID